MGKQFERIGPFHTVNSQFCFCISKSSTLLPAHLIEIFALLHKIHETCDFIAFYFMKNISAKSILPNIIRAALFLDIIGMDHRDMS